MIITFKTISWLVILILLRINVGAQSSQFLLSLGNYEGFQIGMLHSKPKLDLGYGLGTDFNLYNQGWYFQVNGFVGRSVLKKHFKKVEKHLDLKSFIWNIENRSNVFSAVSVNPQLRLSKKLNEQWKLHGYAGLVWSSVFRYERKTYIDVGFPKEWQPGFGISLSRVLKK